MSATRSRSRSSSAPASKAVPGRPRGVPRQVRIIGGQWKRTPLAVLDADGLRPTPDRVRETLFNWLGQDLGGCTCLDLFAGSGALGFEAASRGAARVVMVESLPAAVRQLQAMRDKLHAGMVDIRAGDALGHLASCPPGAFDVIFIDPPFGSPLAARALAAAVSRLKPAGHIYLESGEDMSAALPAELEIVRYLHAGMVHAHLLAAKTS
ncbi:16S rRNA (guanine(966)-N(2))-methyltransferase RsmD [Imbroritus primus]|uniref:16S rRNA (Guanine(966)-N(2))-methyltransferase RsmD n=1 Tax=Imbroritus primus TaxID=3058603 RepID=A0ACD3SM23_9BURK|nr:16S rRNA (guanine(966)-N(2))-methyltransferase RsmD [Burkholderiaceae bacterium PBA]